MVSKQFSFPAVNISIYALDFTGDCIVTCYEHGETLHESIVYIADIEQSFGINLYEEILLRLNCIPTTKGEVFAVDLDVDGIHRAVCNGNQSLLFIDSGEVMHGVVESDLTIFSLSEKAQNISARAIPCTVIEVIDEVGNQVHDLTEILYQQFSFTVHRIENGRLTVTLHRNEKSTLKESHVETRTDVQFTQEELDMLFEEPKMMTTNALKAVLNYVPQDEKLICPFFEPATGRCFKGNTCKLLHVSFLDGGLTRDRKAITHKLNPGYTPLVGSTVKICITSIKSPDEFYANIPEISARSMCGSLNTLKQRINEIELVKQYKPFVGVPDHGDLVLIRHKDVFYRGRVIEDGEKNVLIFFIDYGFIQLVQEKDIFQWHPRWDLIPAQVYRCSLANIQLHKRNDEETTNKFRNLVLNGRDISAEIIAVTEDVYVIIRDVNGFDIGEALCVSGLAQFNSKHIPSSTNFPG